MELIKVYKTRSGKDAALLFTPEGGTIRSFGDHDNPASAVVRIASRRAETWDGGRHRTMNDYRADADTVVMRAFEGRACVMFPQWSANTRRTQTATIIPRKAGGAWVYLEKQDNVRRRGNSALELTAEQTKAARARIMVALLAWRSLYRWVRPPVVLAE